MAAVYQEITLTWKDEEYTIRPTMRLMQDIEQQFSLSRVAHRITQGDTPLSHMAAIVAIMLRSAGCKVTDDDVFQELLQGSSDDIQEMAIALITAAFPIKPEKKGNAKAPAKKAAKSTKSTKK